MKDRDCESCKKFSRVDPHESEGYCDAKRTWVDPQEGEDCKMHEFTLHSATKYKDGTPIMSEPKVDINSSYPESVYSDTGTYEERKAAKNGLYGKYASNQLDDEVPEGFHRTPFGLMPNSLFHPDNDYLKEDASREQIIEFVNATADDVEQLKDFIYNDEDPEGYSHYKLVKETAQRVFDLNLRLEGYVEEYDAVLKTHGDTLEEHLDRICDLEHMYEKVLDDLCAMRDRLCKITDLLVGQDEFSHIFSNFCGNCIHAEMEDGLCTCALSGEALDPDYASCSRFDPSFTHIDDRPDWMEKIRKDMTTPSEPTEGCKDCKCAVDGMCVKHNCSLGAICATPECYEPTPF